MCGIVAALPVYQRLSEEISLAELAELIPQLPLAIAEPGSDPEQMASALRGASDRLAAAIDAFAAPSAVKPLASCAEAADPVSAALDRLAGSVAALDAVFDQHAAEWEADVTEQAQRLLRDVKDQVWALRHDRVQAAVRSSELAGAEWNDRSVISYVAINSVLDALDRLEVRGRDSAGIAIWVRLAPEDRAQLRELSSRDDALLRNDSAVVAESGVGFVYKRAAIVGRLGDNTWFLRRSIMNDADLQQALNLPSAAVTVVSHTRWASVGRTSEANAHPVDNRHSDGGFTGPRSLVVLNGDVDNYLALQEECRYSSDDAGVTTDAKLLPLLLSKGLDEKQSSDQAMRSTLAACEGSMAIAAMCEDAPDEILLAVKGSGQSLYVGFAPSGYLVASEAYGLVGVTRRFARVEGQQQAGAAAAGSVVRLARDGAGAPEAVRRWDADGRSLPLREADVRLAEVTTHDLALGEYEHYLQKEIHEAASSFHKTLRGRIHQDADQKPYVSLPDSSLPSQLRDGLRDGKLRKLVIVGQGTAAVAGEGIAQMIELSVGDKVETHACPATEFSAWQLRPDMSDTLIVAVSQSGTTTDTNRAVDLARARGASVISIVNRRDSDLGEKSDGILYTSDGRDVELSVASTKAFYAQIAAGCLLGAEVAKELGCLTPARENSLLRGLARIPEQLRALHQADDRIAAVAGEVATRHPYWSVVGSGPNRVAADEVRIKASELCYMTISADAVEDKKHIDLSAEALVLVCVAGAPPHQVTDLIKEVEILNAHRNRAVVICDEGTEHLWPTESVIGVPQAHPELAWILAVAAGHLFSYHAARAIDAAAHPVRQALARLEAAVDEGSAVARPLPVEVGLLVQQVLGAAARGEMRGVLTSQAALGLAGVASPSEIGPHIAASGAGPAPEDRVAGARAALTAVLDELARPIDTVKHQAKTVTVGTSRSDSDLYDNDITQTLLKAGADRADLTYPVLDVIRAHARVVRKTTGVTRYQIHRDAAGATLRVISKTGSTVGLTSRADSGAPLTGSKRRVAELRVPRLVRGQMDGRIVLIVPEHVAGEIAAVSVAHVELQDPSPLPDLRAAMDSVGDRMAEIVAAVTEIRADFAPDELLRLPIDTVLLDPIEVLTESLARKPA